MPRSHKAIDGFAVDLLGQIITQFLTFVSIPIIISNTNQSNYGFWLTIGSIMSWISITDLGIGTALTRQLIKVQTIFAGDQLLNKRNILLSTSFVFFLFAGIVFFVCSVFLYPLTIKWFHISAIDSQTYFFTYFLAGFAGAISLPLSIYGGVLEANQKMVLNRNVATVASLFNIFLSVVSIYFLKDVQFLALSLLLTVLLKSLILYFYAHKNYEFSLNFSSVSKHEFQGLLKFGGNFQLAKLANTVASNTDNLFIGSYLGMGFVPIYTFTSKLYQTFSVVIVSKISGVLFPGLAEIFDQEGQNKIQFIFTCLIKLLFRIGILGSVLVFLFNHVFVRLWVGEFNFGGDYLNWVLVYLLFYETLFRGTAALIMVYGDMANWAYVSLIEAILNIAFSTLLIQDYGLTGIAFATAVSRTFTTGAYLIFYFVQKGLINKSLIKVVLEVLLKSIPSIAFLFMYKLFIVDYTWLGLIAGGILGILINIITFDLLTIWRFKQEGWRNILSKLLYNGN
jgi:O-antigen/teichoic acid export membrane protein